jgi:AcrR family transcriptional regulator
MKTTAREIRIIAESLQSTPAFPATERERLRHENIIECARIAMAEKGFANITMAAFAIGMRIAVATMRRHFCDLDALLAHLVRLHLQAVSVALGKIDPNAPDPARARRAAYLAATRRPYGGFTNDHLLLVRDSPSLPPDELETIEKTRDGLARLLAGPNCDCPDRILNMLDNQAIEPADMEHLIAKYAAPLTAEQQKAERAFRAASTAVPKPAWQLPPGPPGKPNTIYSPTSPPEPWGHKAPESVHNTA